MSSSSRLLLRAAAVVSLGSAMLGCQKSNETARQDVAKASGYAAAGATDKALEQLKGLGSETLSSGTTISAKSLRGHVKADQAMAKISELTETSTQVARLGSEIGQIANVVASGNALLTGYKATDASAARAQIKAKIAEAEGVDGNGVWDKTGTPPLPTLSAGKALDAKLAGQVEAKQGEIQKLEAQRASALKTADELSASMDGMKGRAAVDTFAKASGARRDVAGMSNAIEVAQGQLGILQRDRAVVSGQVGVIEGYVAALREKDKALASGFEVENAKIGEISKVSSGAVNTGTKESPSLNAKAEELGAATKKADELYSEAHKLLEEAGSEYKAAFTEAQEFRQSLDNQAGASSGKDRDVVVNLLKNTQSNTLPAVYRAEMASALSDQAMLEAQHAAMLAARAELAGQTVDVLKKAGLGAPGEMAVKSGEVKSAWTEAWKTFGQADIEFENAYNALQGGGALTDGRRSNFAAGKMFMYYAWCQALRSAGDEKGAAEKLKSALIQRDLVKVLPPLPTELAPPPPVVPVPATPATEPSSTTEPAPTTEPSTEPSTQPSTGPSTGPSTQPVP